MSAAAPRTAQATPDMRQLGVALGAIILAVALLAAVAFSQQAASQSTTLPAAGTAPVVHDRGLVNASYEAAPRAHDHGWIESSSKTRPAIRGRGFDKAHAPAGSIKVTSPVQSGGGTLYTGIPYAPSVRETGSGSNGTRFAQ